MHVLTEPVQLSAYTTLRLGGPAARLAEARTSAELVEAVRQADRRPEPLLVLGGGSNLVVADDGFAGTVVRVATSGIAVTPGPVGGGDDGGGGIGGGRQRVLVTVAAGENWDQLVEWAVAERLAGLECLAGIPGLTGATPIQNVGAYGQEVATTIESVRVLDRATSRIVMLTRAECGFGYRTSAFKAAAFPPAGASLAPPGASLAPPGESLASPGDAERAVEPGTPDLGPGRQHHPTGRYVVLEVTFALARDPMSVPVRYAELAAKLGVAVGDRAPLDDVRAAVLLLRRGKGMVLDPADPDTASAGSFFTNPVLDRGQLASLEAVLATMRPGVAVPTFPAPGDQVKVPAAWLIEQAGFGKGYPDGGAARISSKHTLALTNRGSATTADLMALARQIVAGVRSMFGIELTNEPVLVGVTL